MKILFKYLFSLILFTYTIFSTKPNSINLTCNEVKTQKINSLTVKIQKPMLILKHSKQMFVKSFTDNDLINKLFAGHRSHSSHSSHRSHSSHSSGHSSHASHSSHYSSTTTSEDYQPFNNLIEPSSTATPIPTATSIPEVNINLSLDPPVLE